MKHHGPRKIDWHAELRAAFAAPPARRRAAFLAGLPAWRPNTGVGWLLWVQLRYLRWRVWLAAAGAAGFCFWLASVPGRQDDAWALAAVLPLVTLVLVCELARAARFGMAELEAACRYSLRQAVMARTLLLGAAMLPVLAAALAALHRMTALGLAQAAVYLLTPWLLSAGGSLWVLNRFRGAEGGYACAAVCCGVSAGRFLLTFFDEAAAAAEFLPLWQGALAAAILLTGWQARRWYRQTLCPQ